MYLYCTFSAMPIYFQACDVLSPAAILISTFFQWDLVCQKDYLKDTSQTVMVAGVMCGAMIFSVFSDLFGRKPVFLFRLVCKQK